jgi:RNA polymerase sigma factor (sigma-70 family)
MTEESRPPISDLLAQRQDLEQLALRMSGHRDGADELLQEAWLVAMERPPRHGANPAAWLRGVLRRVWHRRRRHAVRTRAAELDPALPAETAPADVDLERAEILAEVARFVMELEEPYRSVLVLRFYEGRTPTEIATQLARPVNTVASQLARALERLRARLEARHGDERARGSGLLLAWLGRVARVAPGSEPARRTRAGSFGLSRTARVACAGALAALSLVFLLWYALAHDERANREVAAGPSASAESLDVLTTPADVVRASVEPDPLEPPGLGWVELEVLDEAGLPVPDVTLKVTRSLNAPDAPREKLRFEHARVGETDARGKLRFAQDGSLVAWRALDGEDTAWNQVDWIGLSLTKEGLFESDYECFHHLLFPSVQGSAVHVWLQERSLALRGNVSDAEGRGLSGTVRIDFELLPEPQEDGSLLLHSPLSAVFDEQGDYEADRLPPGFHALWCSAPGYVPRADWVEGARGAKLVRDFVLQRGASVTGLVTDAEGNPVSGARVRYEYRSASLPFTVLSRTNSGPDGDFELTGIHDGWVHVTAEDPKAPGVFDAAFLDMRGVEEREWIPELREREPLRVQVRTDEGAALAGCVVSVTRPDLGDDWSVSRTADAGGSVSINGLPPSETLELEIFRTLTDFIAGAPPCAFAQGIVAGLGVREIVVPRARLRTGILTGRLLVGAGETLSRARLYLRASAGGRFHPVRFSERDGTLRSEPCSGRYSATLVCAGRGALALGALEIVAGETCALGDIRLPPLARFELDWRWTQADLDYELVALGDVARPSATEAAPMEWLVVAGSAPVPASLPLLPGRYRWSIRLDGRAIEKRSFELGPAEVLVLTTGPSALLEPSDR